MKSVVVISDLHIGSHSGLIAPNGIHLDNGAKQAPSKIQRYTWKCWQHFWGEFVPHHTKGAESITVVINGDAIDGNHHQAVDIVPNVAIQERAAIEILKPIAEKYQTFMVRGTEAHGGIAEQSTERIAQALGCPKDDQDNHSVWQLWLSIDGVIIQFAHHIGTTSSAAYETSAPMRELVAGLVEATQWGMPMADLYVRSHRHRYTSVPIPTQGDKDIQLIVTPGWQVRTPHVERIDRMRLPHIGGVVVNIEEELCQIKKKLYAMPKPRPIHV